ncbi:MAG: DUF2232 domain-containing protein [Treponema sp.]|jgi:hypothetical protein|nr:DUF2232 domain-containing protein [Treponema sp.]
MAVQPDPEIPIDEGASVLKTAGGVVFIPALVSAVICVGLIRSGFPAFFFLVPLGFMAYGYNLVSVWVSALGSVLMNGILAWGLALSSTDTFKYPWADMLYFTCMIAVFTWIVAPPFKKFGFLRISLAYRFMAGSVIGALLLWFIIEATQDGFEAFLRSQGEMLSSLYAASAGTDVVQRSLMEQYVTPESVINLIGSVMFRGGGVASCAVVFLLSRQISLVFTRLIRRISIQEHIGSFHAASGFIWALSFSLLGVLAGTWASIIPLEILAWNMITICAILYLVQGGGILWYFLSRKDLSPVMRTIITIPIIILIFSPGINAAVLGLLILLGIAENWVPFRAPKSDRPSSTPGM